MRGPLDQFEDDAWSDSGVIGILIAVALVAGVVGVASWLDGIGGLHQFMCTVAGG